MIYLYIFLLFFALPLQAKEELYLRENLKKAQKGDYLVTAQGKMATLLHINERAPDVLTIEEISIPHSPKTAIAWKEWIKKGAPGSTAWVLYEIELSTGRMLQCYSRSRGGWLDIPQADNFLSTLLNLRLTLVPEWQRKKAGPPPLIGFPDKRLPWQPRLFVEGKEVPGVLFDVWRTHWPKDGTVLGDKTIEVYLPKEDSQYPAYFPYWLQISGIIGKAQIHIIDSGHQMASPVSLPRKKT